MPCLRVSRRGESACVRPRGAVRSADLLWQRGANPAGRADRPHRSFRAAEAGLTGAARRRSERCPRWGCQGAPPLPTEMISRILRRASHDTRSPPLRRPRCRGSAMHRPKCGHSRRADVQTVYNCAEAPRIARSAACDSSVAHLGQLQALRRGLCAMMMSPELYRKKENSL